MLGKNACQLHEESWVSFPFCKTVLTNPTYMGEDFKVTIESYHLDNDRGDTRGLLGYPKDVSVKVLDIIGETQNSSSTLSIFQNGFGFR